MEPEGSLLHSQGPAILPILSQLNPEHTPISHFLKIKLLSECPITHISKICTHTHTHNNEGVDVLSDYPVH
jgi:hypothetical protein